MCNLSWANLRTTSSSQIEEHRSRRGGMIIYMFELRTTDDLSVKQRGRTDETKPTQTRRSDRTTERRHAVHHRTGYHKLHTESERFSQIWKTRTRVKLAKPKPETQIITWSKNETVTRIKQRETFEQKILDRFFFWTQILDRLFGVARENCLQEKGDKWEKIG